jgi:hypothetical protein
MKCIIEVLFLKVCNKYKEQGSMKYINIYIKLVARVLLKWLYNRVYIFSSIIHFIFCVVSIFIRIGFVCWILREREF